MDFCIKTRMETEERERYIRKTETIEKEVKDLCITMPLQDFIDIWEGCDRGGYVAQRAVSFKYRDFVSSLKEL
jgi:hypothetical protein